jgi:hypothetical protein
VSATQDVLCRSAAETLQPKTSDPAAVVSGAIGHVFKILAHLPCDQGMAALWAEARELRDEIDAWQETPPSPSTRADVIRRVLRAQATVAAVAGFRATAENARMNP